jgi:hypothetical protein
MIVSTLQFLQKQVRGRSVGRVAKSVKLAAFAELKRRNVYKVATAIAQY